MLKGEGLGQEAVLYTRAHMSPFASAMQLRVVDSAELNSLPSLKTDLGIDS